MWLRPSRSEECRAEGQGYWPSLRCGTRKLSHLERRLGLLRMCWRANRSAKVRPAGATVGNDVDPVGLYHQVLCSDSDSARQNEHQTYLFQAIQRDRIGRIQEIVQDVQRDAETFQAGFPSEETESGCDDSIVRVTSFDQDSSRAMEMVAKDDEFVIFPLFLNGGASDVGLGSDQGSKVDPKCMDRSPARSRRANRLPFGLDRLTTRPEAISFARWRRMVLRGMWFKRPACCSTGKQLRYRLRSDLRGEMRAGRGGHSVRDARARIPSRTGQ